MDDQSPDWSEKNTEPERQHFHDWSEEKHLRAHLASYKTIRLMQEIYMRLGYATIAYALSLTLAHKHPEADYLYLRGALEGLGSRYNQLSVTERRALFPWSACHSASVGFRVRKPVPERYMRLLRAIRWTAVLSDGEAVACLVDYKLGRSSGEAVTNFGGPAAVVERAIRNRQYSRHMWDAFKGRGREHVPES